jgi:DNA invertase Pin-like site-specific DNA recombinase
MDNYTTKYLLGYVRKSIVEVDPDDHDAPEPVSLQRQKNAINRWAQSHNYRVKFYEDVDISGRYEANRPGWQQLRTALDDNDVAGVIVEAFDRDHRNLREFLAFHDDELHPRDQKLISATQNIDVSTTDGRAMASVLMAFAEMESRKASDRMKDTINFQRERHGKYFGPPLFGCDRSNDGVLIPTAKTYWLHPDTGLAGATEPADSRDWEERYYINSLVMVFRIYATGNISYANTAAKLNAQGWRYSGKAGEPVPFTDQRVRDVVRNYRTYGGELRVGRSRKNQVYIEGAHDPILPPELIAQAAAVFNDRSRKADNRSAAKLYLVSGIAHCATCGKPLDGHFLKGHRRLRHRYGRGQCKEPVPFVDALETELLDALIEIPLHPEIYSGIIAKVDQMIAAVFNTDEAERVARIRLDDLGGKLARLKHLYIEGDIGWSAYQSRKAIIDSEIAKESAKTKVQIPHNLRDVAAQVIDNLAQIDGSTPQTQKTLVHSLVKRLDITHRQISKLIPTDWASPFFFSLAAGVEGGCTLTTAHPPHQLKIINWL